METIPGGLVDRWGNRKISDIKKREIIDLLDGIAEDAPVMANRTLAAIRRLFNWCLEKDRIQFSPCAGLKQGKEHHRTRVLSDDEIRLFWQACDELKFPYGSAAKLLLLTGARRSEVGEMTLEEIKEGVWTVPAARTKNKKAHTVPLSSAAIALLKDAPSIKGARGLIFTLNGRVAFTAWHLVRDRLHELMVAKAPGTKIAPWRLHDLRRTMASGMARLGIKLEVIEKCLNHVSGSFAGVVGVYQLHSFEKEKREAFDKWGEEVERIVAGKPALVQGGGPDMARRKPRKPYRGALAVPTPRLSSDNAGDIGRRVYVPKLYALFDRYGIPHKDEIGGSCSQRVLRPSTSPGSTPHGRRAGR